ncbi:hypothetical protein EDB81DRAFT_762329 [Dactylonectria macrodidyma]|uniref:Uncharacterized protein n=1 Tax=Dactylonectria macrodidyma TaxID=307937 RepID=A0A9P9EB92_9HYPO|nr:hypothetical protein EDB81DRAFT_762329 [Dactylonectria macrodidyma]
MCLTLITHQTECDTRRPVIISMDSHDAIFHPLETPAPCCHKQDADETSTCNVHGSCCVLKQWSICNVSGDASPCHGNQVFHRVVTSEHQAELVFEECLFLSENAWPFRDNNDRYSLLRREFFDAAAQVAMCSLTADLLGQQAPEHLSYGRLRWELQEIFEKWHSDLYDLTQATMKWEEHAAKGEMEPCPSQGLTRHPYARCYQDTISAPNISTTPSQWTTNYHFGIFAEPRDPGPRPGEPESMEKRPLFRAVEWGEIFTSQSQSPPASPKQLVPSVPHTPQSLHVSQQGLTNAQHQPTTMMIDDTSAQESPSTAPKRKRSEALLEEMNESPKRQRTLLGFSFHPSNNSYAHSYSRIISN